MPNQPIRTFYIEHRSQDPIQIKEEVCDKQAQAKECQKGCQNGKKMFYRAAIEFCPAPLSIAAD
jgi:hypothetical protein